METPGDIVITAKAREIHRGMLAELLMHFGEESPPVESSRSRQHLLRQAGLRAGWDDPGLDVYNDLVE